jgi:hypothetical protein
MLAVVDTIPFPLESLGEVVRIFGSTLFLAVSSSSGHSLDVRWPNFPVSILMRTGFEVQETKWPIDWEARVEYALIAKVERSSGGSKLFGAKIGKSRSLEETLQLRLQDELEGPYVEQLAAGRSLLNFKECFDEPHGPWLMRKLNILPKTNSGHTVSDQCEAVSSPENGGSIIFYVETASAVRASSSRLPFKITVSIPDKARAAAVGSFTVCDVKVNLLRKTSVRDDSLSATDHTAMQISKQVLCQRKDMEKKFEYGGFPDRERAKPPSYEDENSTQATGLGHVDEAGWQLGMTDTLELPDPEWLTPTFSTYNIAVEYSLDFEVKIRISGLTVISLKSMEHPTGNPKILILPLSSPKTGLTGNLDAPQAEAAPVLSKEAEVLQEASGNRGNNAEEDSLPAYEP